MTQDNDANIVTLLYDGPIYAIGDIHGCADELQDILGQIEDHAYRSALDEYPIIFLGDYIDRGPDSKRVLDTVIGLRDGLGPNRVFCLRGNHEDLLLGALDEQDSGKYVTWFMRNGGDKTLKSYGWNEDYPPDAEVLQGIIPETHWQFLRSTVHMVQTAGCAFVHAGIDPRAGLLAQDPNILMWIRDRFLTHQGEFPKFIVHGHTPQKPHELTANDHRCNLDSKAYKQGVLTAGIIDSFHGRLIQRLQTEPRMKPAFSSNL